MSDLAPLTRADLPLPSVALVVLDGWGIARAGPGNAVSLATTPVFDALWERYRGRVSYVRDYERMVRENGATFFNDHVAFRTLGTTVGTNQIGMVSLAVLFRPLGFRPVGAYEFKEKRLRAVHLQHPDPTFPKLFVSELEVEKLSPAEAESRFKGFRVPASMASLHERRAGYLRVEECVVAHVEEAQQLGATVRTGETVLDWSIDGTGARVRTDQGSYLAARLVITAGPWAGDLLKDLGLPLEVRRKPVFWYKARGIECREAAGCPAFLFETFAGFFYGFPETKEGTGLKVAGGEVVSDPLHIDRSLRPEDRGPVESFLDQYLPSVTRECLKHSVCMYTMTPDEHFAIGLHPEHSQVAFAAGLSGHGFKFTGVLGEALADLALEGKTSLPIGFLSPRRLSPSSRSK